MMSSRRAGIGINLNVQRAVSSPDYQDFVKTYRSDTEYWKKLWTPRYQQGDINPDNPDNVQLFSGVCDFRSCLPTFVGIHSYMRDTPFEYRGCYRYYERSSKTAGPQYMLSLRYERKWFAKLMNFITG